MAPLHYSIQSTRVQCQHPTYACSRAQTRSANFQCHKHLDISLPRPTLHATQPIYSRAQETAAQESPGLIRPDHPERKLGTPEVQWPLGVRRHCATYGNQSRTTAATGSLFSISVSVSRSRHVSGPVSPIDADRKVRLDGTSFVESFRPRQTLKAFKAFKIPATTYNM